MTTSASPGSMWSGLGQIYVGMQDGTLHAFGFNDERRATNEAVGDPAVVDKPASMARYPFFAASALAPQ